MCVRLYVGQLENCWVVFEEIHDPHESFDLMVWYIISMESVNCVLLNSIRYSLRMD